MLGRFWGIFLRKSFLLHKHLFHNSTYWHLGHLQILGCFFFHLEYVEYPHQSLPVFAITNYLYAIVREATNLFFIGVFFQFFYRKTILIMNWYTTFWVVKSKCVWTINNVISNLITYSVARCIYYTLGRAIFTFLNW